MSMMLGGALLQVPSLKALQELVIHEQADRREQQRLSEIPKSCRGCRNFHGKIYGGVMLVCALHPEGVEGDTCPDYEISKQTKSI
jgi:hypothetical protein